MMQRVGTMEDGRGLFAIDAAIAGLLGPIAEFLLVGGKVTAPPRTSAKKPGGPARKKAATTAPARQSPKATERACAVCGKTFLGVTSQKLCSPDCRKLREQEQKHGASPDPASREARLAVIRAAAKKVGCKAA